MTDMEAVMGGWKKTWDLVEGFLGLPANSQPGEEWLRFHAMNGGVHGGCNSGGSGSEVNTPYARSFQENEKNVFILKWQ